MFLFEIDSYYTDKFKQDYGLFEKNIPFKKSSNTKTKRKQKRKLITPEKIPNK